jgi:5'-3' exonuclease
MSKSFTTMNEPDQKVVLIVDSLNLAFRWKHQGALFFKDEYLRTVESLKKSYKASEVIILSDWGSSSYRKAIYPEYKQNRKEKQEQQSPEEAAYFEKFFEEYLKIVEYYKTESKYPTFRFQGVEADDLAAHIVQNLDNYGFEHAWLVSSDKDWDLLVSDKASRFSYVTRKETTADNWSEHYDVSQEEYISVKCLMGDSGDNVPGIPKVGPSTAKKLIDQYGTALDVANNIPLPGKYVYIKNTNEFGSEAIVRNYQLMDLLTFCDDAIGADNIEIVKNELQR